MDKRLIRDSLRLVSALLFFFLYIPHYLCFVVSGGEICALRFEEIYPTGKD